MAEGREMCHGVSGLPHLFGAAVCGRRTAAHQLLLRSLRQGPRHLEKPGEAWRDGEDQAPGSGVCCGLLRPRAKVRQPMTPHSSTFVLGTKNWPPEASSL